MKGIQSQAEITWTRWRSVSQRCQSIAPIRSIRQVLRRNTNFAQVPE